MTTFTSIAALTCITEICPAFCSSKPLEAAIMLAAKRAFRYSAGTAPSNRGPSHGRQPRFHGWFTKRSAVCRQSARSGGTGSRKRPLQSARRCGYLQRHARSLVASRSCAQVRFMQLAYQDPSGIVWERTSLVRRPSGALRSLWARMSSYFGGQTLSGKVSVGAIFGTTLRLHDFPLAQ